MQETDILLTVAEIGVALAGFASLAAVLVRRYTYTDPLVNAIRLRGLLDSGLSTMLLAMIGVLMQQIGGESQWVWQVASIAGLIFVSTIGVAAFRRERLRRHLPGFRKIASIIMFTLVAVAFVGFAFTAAGFAEKYGFQIFLGILCLLLVICCTMFVLVIASLMKTNKAFDQATDKQHN